MNVGFVSRSTGRSAVQCAAYISGEKLPESRRDLDVDYRNRHSDIAFCQTFAPNHAPEWMKDLSVWDKLESFEDKYALKRYKSDETRDKYLGSAQTAQTYVMALPKELSPQVWQELMTEFVEERFVSRNLIATLAIHNDEGNPHAHIMVSRRSVTIDGEFSFAKDREITTKTELKETRKLWADKANFYLEREGIDAHIDHRSFEDLGIAFEPTKKEGWYANKLDEMGQESRIVIENKEIHARNKERAALDPETVLKELTTNRATFRSEDLARLVQKRVGDDPILCQTVFEQAQQKIIHVGVSLDGTSRYTSKEYLETEQQAISYIDQMGEKKANLTINQGSIQDVLSSPNKQGFMLNSEQQQAVTTLCNDRLVSVLIGRAGTGKTTALQQVVTLHKEAGYEVIGGALAAVAADNLGKEANCLSETLAFHLDKWEKYERAQKELSQFRPSGNEIQDLSIQSDLLRTLETFKEYQLSDKHVLIVDEAGMVGTPTWEKLLHFTNKANAKLIAVGDDHQFKAIEAGDFFRKLIEYAKSKGQLSMLSMIVRQRVEWMRDASSQLAELNTATALSTYEQRGHVKALGDASLIETIATDYVNRLKTSPQQSGLLLASTNDQVAALNVAVREQLLASRSINPEMGVFTLNKLDYAVGDKIVFLQNDRAKRIKIYGQDGEYKDSFLIKNGTTAYIAGVEKVTLTSDRPGAEPIESVKVTVQIEDKTQAVFTINDYCHFAHGYALTLHKSQGQTVDWSLVLASKNMDAFAVYVALTRHRQDTQVYYNKDEFADFSSLIQSLSRLGHKDLAMDYSISPERSEAWASVQEYLVMGRELMMVAEEKQWQDFKDLKVERQLLGRHLLEHWAEHQDFVRQAGLTQESIAINCGLKARPLSLAEEKAQITVEQYAVVALRARDLWQHIRQTHPGVLAKDHPEYALFEQLRSERGSLANVIAAAPSLHRPFMRDQGTNLGYGMSTVQKQAEAFQHRLIQDRLREEIRDPHQRERLEVLDQYIQTRDLAAQTWQQVQPKLKASEGTLIQPMLNHEVDHVASLFKQRDILAHLITKDFESYVHVAQAIRLSLNTEKLFNQAEKGERALLIDQYKESPSLVMKGKAAFDLADQWHHDQVVGAKTTIRDILQAGINSRELQAEAHRFERLQLAASLENDQDRSIFKMLDHYDQLRETAKAHYKLCLEESGAKNIKPWESSYYTTFAEISRDRDALAADLISQPYSLVAALSEKAKISLATIDGEAHRHSLRQTSEVFLSGMGSKSVFAAQELRAWLDFDRDMGSKHTFNIMREFQYMPRDVIQHIREAETKAIQGVQQQRPVIRTPATSKDMNDLLKDQMKELCKAVLGEPFHARAREWRYGRKGSISVFVSGSKQGLYANFETGVSGGPLKMIEDQLKLNPEQSLNWAKEWFGQIQTKEYVSTRQPSKTFDKEQTWTPVLPVPAHAGKPEIETNRFLSYMVKGKAISALYPYLNDKKEVLGYVVRVEDKDGHKITPTLTYCQNDKGQQYWRWQGFGDKRPLYGLDRLEKNKPVLIVEGEKAADAAQRLLPDYAVLSWPGGAGAVRKTDWTPLIGKNVTVWPDNDAPGFKAAQTIKETLSKFQQEDSQTQSVKIVDLPKELPQKWDLADPLPEGWTVDHIRQIIRIAHSPEKGICQQTILDTIQKYRLNLSFGEPEAKTYETIAHLYSSYKELHKVSYQAFNEKEVLERCTFMALQIQHLSKSGGQINDDNLARHLAVAASLWMEGKDNSKLEFNHNVYFLAKGHCRKNDQQIQDAQPQATSMRYKDLVGSSLGHEVSGQRENKVLQAMTGFENNIKEAYRAQAQQMQQEQMRRQLSQVKDHSL